MLYETVITIGREVNNKWELEQQHRIRKQTTLESVEWLDRN
jgi:hypothetical protein